MITTLPRNYQYNKHDYLYTQVVNTDFLNGQASCAYCRRKKDWGDGWTYGACAYKYHCLYGALFWADLDATHNEQIVNTLVPGSTTQHAYAPAPLIRSVKVDNLYRYVQLHICHIPNVHCNAMCHYYADKVANKTQTIKCANSHGCGYAGGFFELLRFVNPVLNKQLSFPNEKGQQ